MSINLKSVSDFRKSLFINEVRDRVVLKNVTLSFIFKGINILTQLALVPITISYLDKDQYGIWLTLSAIIGWFGFFDVGLGNGLRNKLAEAIALDDILLARSYISTTYAIMAIIIFSLLSIFFLIHPLLPWSILLNAPLSMDIELSNVALVTFSFFCLRFIFGVIGNILFAVHKAALNSLINTLVNILSVFFIYLLQFIISDSLFWVGTIFSALPVIVLLIITLTLFNGKLSYISPSIKLIDFSYSKDLLGLGYKFFVIQIAGIVLFSSTNLMISQLYGPGEVTAYNIAFRYFTLLSMIYSIILSPMWSTFTEAFVKGEIKWIRSAVFKLNSLALFFAIICIIMICYSDQVYKIWVGEQVVVPKVLTIVAGIYTILTLFAAPYNTFINGVGKVKLQYYSAYFSILTTIPIALFFSKKLNLGAAGILSATLCTTLPCTILWIIQYKKIINGRALGIWGK